jgi:Ino eighty subunit 1
LIDVQPLATVHFPSPYNFLDLFLPTVQISSEDRGRAFLWLIYHYLEGPTLPNPYDDDFSRRNTGKIPRLRRVATRELQNENVDLPEETRWGLEMSNQRSAFLQKLVLDSTEQERERDSEEVEVSPLPGFLSSTFHVRADLIDFK